MTGHDIFRQLGLISGLLDGVASTEALKPDLVFVGVKLRWLTTRVIPQCCELTGFERANCLAEAARLQQRWVALYFDTGNPSPDRSAVASSQGSLSAPGPWTAAERRFIDHEGGFDDIAFRLMSVFGRMKDESRLDGRWVVSLPCGHTYDAGLIRTHLGKVGSNQKGMDGLYQIAEDALLLSAGNGIRVDAFEEIAETLGPLVPELLDELPTTLVWRLISRLIGKCLTLGGTPAHRPGCPAEPGVLVFTEAGFTRAAEAFHVWWPYSRQSGWQARNEPAERAPLLPQSDNDIPF